MRSPRPIAARALQKRLVSLKLTDLDFLKDAAAKAACGLPGKKPGPRSEFGWALYLEAGCPGQRSRHRHVGRKQLPPREPRTLQDRKIEKTGSRTTGFRRGLAVFLRLSCRTIGQFVQQAARLLHLLHLPHGMRSLVCCQVNTVSLGTRVRSRKQGSEKKDACNENLKQVAHGSPNRKTRILYRRPGRVTIELSVIEAIPHRSRIPATYDA